MDQKREITIVTEWFGHSLTYAKIIWPYFLENGFTIYHVTNRPDEAALFLEREFPAHFGRIEHIGLETVSPVPNVQGDTHLSEIEAYWSGLRATLQKLSLRLGRLPGVFHAWIDLKSHPFLDAKFISAALPESSVGLCIHPVEFRIFKTWKRRLYEGIGNFCRYGKFTESRIRSLNTSHLSHLYLLDEMVVEKVAGILNHGTKVRSFPEPVDVTIDEVDIPRLRSLKQQGYKVLSVVGFLHKRKGILNMIRTAQRKPDKWLFLFAGPLDREGLSAADLREVNEWRKNTPENCIGHLVQLSDAQVNFVIQQSDLVFLAYEDFFHSSNIQIKAAIFQKPIVAGPQHLISERTKKYHLGWCLKDHDPGTLFDLLDGLDDAAIEKQISQADFQSLTAQHSSLRLKECLDEISSSLGIRSQSGGFTSIKSLDQSSR